MRVLMLCDGGESLGVGHVMRSLALAEEAVAAGHEVSVAGQFEGSFVQGQIAAAPIDVVALGAPVAGVDPQLVLDLVGRLRPDVVHLDSYGAPDGLGELVASAGVGAAGRRIVFSNMEDGTFGRRLAEVVIDPTFGAETSLRPADGSRWILRGSSYTAVRQNVIEVRRRTDDGSVVREVGEVASSVLVVMGGTDPCGLAPSAVGLLAGTGLPLDVTAIAVGENARRTHASAEGSALSLTVLAPVDDLAALMARHDLVISAAGTSIWELCCIGVPTAAVWAVDNQRQGYDMVVDAGAAIGLGGPVLGADSRADERAVELLARALTDSQMRSDLVAAGRRIVDGLGAWRVVQTWELAHRRGLSEPARPASDPVTLVARPATLQDARLLWQWRNDPATRAGSRSSAEVRWEDHLRWLTASLASPDRLLLVVEDGGDGGEPVGTVRWDLMAMPEGGTEVGQPWEVSITVAPDRRGRSLGRPLLRAAELALSQLTHTSGTDVTAYLAVVHRDNDASVRLFESSGYVPDLPSDPQGFMRLRKDCSGTLRAMIRPRGSA